MDNQRHLGKRFLDFLSFFLQASLLCDVLLLHFLSKRNYYKQKKFKYAEQDSLKQVSAMLFLFRFQPLNKGLDFAGSKVEVACVALLSPPWVVIFNFSTCFDRLSLLCMGKNVF